ncbi:tetratricopeptide repeat protein, partial [Streptomyces sp. A 4/2]|uniref:tetratricopeptide repeat protein n=1 Tax=Streptomyces sp. A 4/2 TaxID=2934314 RepID=UPI00202541F3
MHELQQPALTVGAGMALSARIQGVVGVSGSRPSRQELNRRRRRSGFIGRSSELGVFRENLARDPEGEAFQYLFHVRGQAGVGKTSLVRQWEIAARDSQAVAAYLDDDVHSVIEAMEAISAQFARQDAELKQFEKLLASYRQRRHEAETHAAVASASPEDAAGAPVSASVSSTVMAQAGLAGLGLLPGMGAIAGAMDPQQVARTADRARAALSTRLRSPEDVQLVMSPLRVLTPVFLEDLAAVARRRPLLVLFFDVYERTGPVLDQWLSDVLVGEEYGELPGNVVAVLSGQSVLNAGCWGDHLDLVDKLALDVFTDDEARRLLATRGITDQSVIEVILQLSGRLPVLVDLLAQTRPDTVDAVGDPSDTAVERFLKWESDPHHRNAALACALPLQLDEDLFRSIVPEPTADDYAWLRGLPFVTGEAGRCRFHDVVRTSMLRLQRTQSPTRWQQQHTTIADAYRQRRHAHQEGLPTDERWEDPAWREHQLNETYHRLCADPHRALTSTLQQAVRACVQGAGVLRRWAQVLAQAAHDTDNPSLSAWADRLNSPTAEPSDEDALVNALTQLIKAPGLTAGDLALVYAVRGREHRDSGRYEQALTDYNHAFDLGHHRQRIYYGRGVTHFLTGQLDDALTDLAQAIELDPTDAWAITNRGVTHRLTGQYDDALTDYNHAIELDPTS